MDKFGWLAVFAKLKFLVPYIVELLMSLYATTLCKLGCIIAYKYNQLLKKKGFEESAYAESKIVQFNGNMYRTMCVYKDVIILSHVGTVDMPTVTQN